MSLFRVKQNQQMHAGIDWKRKKVPGHGWMLQFSVILFGPLHSFPPNRANIFGPLMLVRKPVPHSFEHFPISHSSHWQSTMKYYDHLS